MLTSNTFEIRSRSTSSVADPPQWSLPRSAPVPSSSLGASTWPALGNALSRRVHAALRACAADVLHGNSECGTLPRLMWVLRLDQRRDSAGEENLNPGSP